MMGLARSTYYYKPKTDPKLKAQQDLDLRDRIEEIQSEFSGYGYRRVQQELKRRGETINTKRVRRVMKLHQLRPLMWGRQVQVTAAQQQFRPYPNRIKYQRVTGLNQAWVADITYIRIRHSFIYLAAILDVYSRKVVGSGRCQIRSTVSSAWTLYTWRFEIGPSDPVAFIIPIRERNIGRWTISTY